MVLECIEWTVEVDSARDSRNLDAQEAFVAAVIAPMYDDLEAGSESLAPVGSLHFTRIFNPPRDSMGAYIRLRVFCCPPDATRVIQEIDRRLDAYFGPESPLQRTRSGLDWAETAKAYGGPVTEALFRDHLHQTSRTASRLLVLKRSGVDIEPLLWPWTHFFFNGVRGYGRSVLELAQGAATGFIENV